MADYFYSNEQASSGLLEEELRELGFNYSSIQDLSNTNLDCFNSNFNNNNSKIFFSTPTCFHNYSQPLNFSFYGDADFTSETQYPYSQPDYCSIPIFDDQPLLPDSDIGAPSQFEPGPQLPTFNMGFNYESERRKNKVKKLSGQPSKNLMAERRRRKRLNDRLAMLRSVVPKISKMDRTSILGDTIDYMKELLERINKLQQEMELGANEMGLLTLFQNAKPEQILIRNSPKFDVQKRNNSAERRIEMCCAGKAGLLSSTVTTLEALGMDIQHCVISCFNDFAMQASCSHIQEGGQRRVLEPEEIKEALFRNAGYGGRCL